MSPEPGTDELARQGAELLGAGRHADALPVYRALVARDPGHRAHWINLGTLLRQEGRLDEALAAYIEAAARGERSASFLYNVGLLHEDRGDYDSARRVLADALAAAPGDVEIRLQYARCC
ncbi:MAG: tetratricopeptide repeat protein, partial [Gammaproteobacteria bacterium]|nr:tetratricopeptide repeat protein [Gammaproteobacteria bacterium]